MGSGACEFGGWEGEHTGREGWWEPGCSAWRASPCHTPGSPWGNSGDRVVASGGGGATMVARRVEMPATVRAKPATALATGSGDDAEGAAGSAGGTLGC